MIKLENPNGYIEVTNNYFANLVGRAAQSCFGVTGMVNSNAYQSLKSVLKNKSAKDNLDQGFRPGRNSQKRKRRFNYRASHFCFIRCKHKRNC